MNYIERLRVLEPVQARTASGIVRSTLSRLRTDIVEGTVERVDHTLGVFEIVPPNGRAVTLSVPYNARTADVE